MYEYIHTCICIYIHTDSQYVVCANVRAQFSMLCVQMCVHVCANAHSQYVVRALTVCRARTFAHICTHNMLSAHLHIQTRCTGRRRCI